ncbi:MAG TPA: hypothetical protein PLP01_15370 [Phycisphaerae bacterium]|nr:hypothetical protein [Phycisphaerae bacterium]
MNGKRAWIVLVAAAALVLCGPGCRWKPGSPTGEAPPAGAGTGSSESGASAAANPSAVAATDNEAASSQGATGGRPTASPDEVARQVAELEAAMGDRTKAAPRGPTATGGTRQTPSPVALAAGEARREAGEVSLTAVRPVAAETGAAKDGSSATAVAPTATPAEAVTLQTLIERYEAMAAKRPADVEVARTLRLLYFAAGQDEKSLEAIPGLPPAEQKLWRDLVWTMMVARDRTPGTDRATHAGEVLDAMEEVRSDLLSEAPLALGEVRFCNDIQGFGVYTPPTANRFVPGQSLLLYTEVRRFTSRREGDGLHHVRLAQRLSLENEQGTVVWRHSFENIDDTCRTPRQDFFLRTTLPLPTNLAAGRYALKVAVEDTVTSRSAGARLELEIVGSR